MMTIELPDLTIDNFNECAMNLVRGLTQYGNVNPPLVGAFLITALAMSCAAGVKPPLPGPEAFHDLILKSFNASYLAFKENLEKQDRESLQ